MKKIHGPLVIGVIQCLNQIFNEGSFAPHTIEKTFKANKKWGARDRRFVAYTVYEMVRNWRRLMVTLGEEWNEQFVTDFSYGSKIENPLFSESLLESLLWVWMSLQDYEGLPEEVKTMKKHWKKLWDKAACTLKEKYSLSDWMSEQGEVELGPLWGEWMPRLHQPAQLYLRTNLLKTSREKLLKAFKSQEIEAEAVEEGAEESILILKKQNVFGFKEFKEGCFEVQDGGSQMIAHFLKVEPKQRVIDACAGAGGKSLHLAALMKNQGKLLCLDIHEAKLKELRRRSSRAGVNIIEARWIKNSKVIKRLHESADRVLLDVPCSGVGVLRRKPDSKWKINKKMLCELHEKQKFILESYAQMVKPGGLLVYSTCSIWPSENKAQVDRFLENHPKEWALEEEKTMDLIKEDFDGFYMARLRRL